MGFLTILNGLICLHLQAWFKRICHKIVVLKRNIFAIVNLLDTFHSETDLNDF